MKTPHLFRVTAPAPAFVGLVVAARELGLRIGWLELGEAAPPPSLAPALAAGCAKAVELGPGGALAAKPRRGPAVLADVLREFFPGYEAVLVRGEGMVLPEDTPFLEVVEGGFRTGGQELRAEDLRKTGRRTRTTQGTKTT